MGVRSRCAVEGGGVCTYLKLLIGIRELLKLSLVFCHLVWDGRGIQCTYAWYFQDWTFVLVFRKADGCVIR